MMISVYIYVFFSVMYMNANKTKKIFRELTENMKKYSRLFRDVEVKKTMNIFVRLSYFYVFNNPVEGKNKSTKSLAYP